MSFFRNKTNDSNRIGSIPFNFFEIQINHLHINGKSSTIDWLHNKLKKIEEFYYDKEARYPEKFNLSPQNRNK